MPLKTYTVVGWYSRDASNPHVAPFARTVTVRAANPGRAFTEGEKKLNAIYEQLGESVDFLNWYLKEQK